MDFSLFYFANDSRQGEADRYGLLLEGARFADTHGFAAVWTPERHFHPFGGLYPNPSVTGAAVAAVTSRVAVRAGSVVAPLHHPLRVAEEWSVVDNLSNGRAGVSFASGWHAADFALRPEAYADRRRLMIEQAEQIRALWRGEAMTVTDGVGSPQELRIFPPPVQPELPVWLTTGGAVETFEAAGRMGAGVLTHLLGQDLDDLRAKIAAYRAAAPDGRGHVVLMVHTYLGEDEDEARDLVRPALSDYIRSSLGLILSSQLDGKRRIDVAKLPPEEIDFLVEQGFRRYFDDGGLLGTLPKARGVVRRLAGLGVDEVACLVDFGLPDKLVLAGLDRLDELRRTWADER
ncbi:MupA/Atu3671 family FMN-dependent luciferase-like monooxygenase [Actinoplanes sp. RD1]|uniref:MupA/Atu3671 family FMN-dependent luciferase-like monooxygenase n=1 Tax=Actinoplanes sp. RD1 TaxID=3064538 RepID=UPI00274036AB|nr:MupA/Atu3671 family FMN-dependent luciferase-like monooxygenase [Actinoplanes sp. RD1]